MFLETKRLIIRNFYISDLKDLYEILSDKETMKYCEPAYSFEQTKKFLQDFCISKNDAFAIVHKDSQKVIGYILFNAWEASVYEMGWILNKKYWRQGYAYEACSNIIAYAFEKLKINKVIAETIDKQRSIGLMNKLGMKLKKVQENSTKDTCGNLADMYIYEITRS